MFSTPQVYIPAGLEPPTGVRYEETVGGGGGGVVYFNKIFFNMILFIFYIDIQTIMYKDF